MNPTKNEFSLGRLIPKPEPLRVDFSRIPKSLLDYPHWVLWRYVQKDGRWTKPPFQTNEKFAKTNDSRTHATFEQVAAAYGRGGFDGIGLVLRHGLCGIDLDHVIDAGGEIEPWAGEILDRFSGTYIERSPSGTGFHILTLGKFQRCGKAGPGNRLEIYDESSTRYFTLTGHCYD
ncbi:MAG: hypothetical protein K2Y28_12660 [Burkholderiaceae bacterium]|nr:hypothetical protein [Burkholderiaceae bacterium]